MGSFDEAEGELLGVFFKSVIGSMLGGDLLFPEIAAAVEKLEDDGWYPWSQYLNYLETIEGQLGSSVLRNAGQKVVTMSKQIFLDQGFDTLEKLLSAYPAMFDMNVRDVGPGNNVEMIAYEPGHVVMKYGGQQPAAMIEGYFEGFFDNYDELIDTISVDRDDDGRWHVDVRWTP